MHNLSDCYHCGKMAKCKTRDISVESWEILYTLGEVERSEINMPICDQCYNELREVMIERRDEIVKLKVKKPKRKKAS